MSKETDTTGLYVLGFQKALQKLLYDFDANVPTCAWGSTLGSSASAIADELADLVLGMKGYKHCTPHSEWGIRLQERYVHDLREDDGE